MKIYTKFGDQGKTRLVGGACVQKSNPRVECYGTVDELNSVIGIIICNLTSKDTIKDELIKIQNELFNLGSLLACEKKETWHLLPQINETHIQFLETKMDEMTARLAPLTNFILPGGTPAASYLHLARTVCRRAERNTVGLMDQMATDEIEPLKVCLIYLNRLSDYFFVAARFSNFQTGLVDQIWKK